MKANKRKRFSVDLEIDEVEMLELRCNLVMADLLGLGAANPGGDVGKETSDVPIGNEAGDVSIGDGTIAIGTGDGTMGNSTNLLTPDKNATAASSSLSTPKGKYSFLVEVLNF